MPYPLSDTRRHGVAHRMVPQAVNAVCLAFIEAARHSPVVREALDPLDLNWSETPHSSVWKPNIVAGPVCPGMPGRLGINAVRDTLYEWPFDSVSNDCLKEGGRFLFILSTLLRIPIAAFGLKKYFSGTLASRRMATM